MIVSFFSRGTGGGRGPVEYLLGKDFDRELAELLRGDALETIALIDSSPYAKKYTSGCLSFEEADLTPEKKRELMDSFEETLFPGMSKDQYNCLWVEHRDKGRLELNFVIPNIELTTGRRLQPYFYKADQKRVDAWKTIQNIENGFSDPDDPAKRQGLTPAKDLPASSKAIADDLHAGIEDMVGRGEIENRDDIVEALEAAGLKVVRQTKTSISIENPARAGGRNIRLKGGVYGQDFDISKELPREVERRNAAYQQRLAGRLESARERYSYGIGVKQAELANSFKGQRKGYERGHTAAAKSTVVGVPLASRVAHNSSLGVDRLERLARREVAGAGRGDSAGKNDAGELASGLAGGAGRGQELLADGQRKASAFGASDRQKSLVYTTSGVVKDEQRESRDEGFSTGRAVSANRYDTIKSMSGLRKGFDLYPQSTAESEESGQGREAGQRQNGQRAGGRSGVLGHGHSLRAVPSADDRGGLSLFKVRATGGRVNDGDRAGFLRHIKQVGERLHQRFRGVATGIAAARNRFFESCQRLGGAGEQLEQASEQLERAERGAERASAALSGAFEALVMRVEQEQKQAKNVKPDRGFRMR